MLLFRVPLRVVRTMFFWIAGSLAWNLFGDDGLCVEMTNVKKRSSRAEAFNACRRNCNGWVTV